MLNNNEIVSRIIIELFAFLSFSQPFLKNLYYLQIKEYRMDRFYSYIKEVGIVEAIIIRYFYKPALSFRNLLITIFSIIVLSLVIYFSIGWFPTSDIGFIINIIFTTLIARVFGYILPIVGALITEPIVQYHRTNLVKKAAAKVKNSKADFIGITGSYGKSSTKEFLNTILSTKYEVEKTPKNYNSDIGVAISVNTFLKPTTQIFIAEMGAYRIGEIKASTDIVHPKYGILTGIGNQHLDLFGSQENIITGKSELFQALPADGIALVNADSEYYQKSIENIKAKVLTYSISQQNTDIRAKDIKLNEKGLEFTFEYKENKFKIHTNLIGAHNILNLLPCIALALEFNIPQKEIIESIEALENPDKHLQKTIINEGMTLIEDNSNSNLNGFLSAIEVLKQDQSSSTKFLISKGIIELGSSKTESYTRIMKDISQSNINLLTTDKTFEEVANSSTKNQLQTFASEKEILAYLNMNLTEKNVILLEGRFSQTFINNLKQIR